MTDCGNVRSAVRVDSSALLRSSPVEPHAEGGASSTESGVCWAPRCDFATGLQSTRGGTAMQHVLGCRQLPIFTRWCGPSKCRSDSKRRVLGPLGGQPPHDPKETSVCGGSDFARVVAGLHIAAVGVAREELVPVAPSLTRLAEGLRPVVLDPEDQRIGMPGHGWQQGSNRRRECTPL